MTKNFTCLLVDDDCDDQEIFLSVLHDIDPTVQCVMASNGQDAIEKLSRHEVEPDVIFVDMNMPLMSGKQFLVESTRLVGMERIPVIILTTSSDQKTLEESLRLGARDYITKPDRFSDWWLVLKDKIDALREGV